MMAEISAENSHEIFIWDADELSQSLSKAKDGLSSAVEFNDQLKSRFDADAVSITQLIQSGLKIARQIRLLGVFGKAYIKELNGKII